ncbi:unnamed protein product [Microthlaspi erraticum]|uniref:DUF1985 domain-containing protein n=1 Tax=Microthlaspi erraticum TaxID=1685480 RepID=A0A6D2IHR6_9BRAS|nr:unnamed protein product [Microthlaspi erraticum]
MWMAFGGKPLRFGLPEFAAITGLPCGPFDDDCDETVTPPIPEGEVDSTWKEIVSNDPKKTLGDIDGYFTSKKIFAKMSDDRKFKLALILIVDGALVVTYQYPKPTPKYVSMLADVEKFIQYPWGWESFNSTLTTLRPEPKGTRKDIDPVEKFSGQTRRGTMRLQGFPYALQLLAFKTIPILQNWLSSSAEDHTLFHIPDTSVLAQYQWDDEITDRRVLYLEKKIQDVYSFALNDWPHGDASLQPLLPKPPNLNKFCTGNTFWTAENGKTLLPTLKNQNLKKISTKQPNNHPVLMKQTTTFYAKNFKC